MSVNGELARRQSQPFHPAGFLGAWGAPRGLTCDVCSLPIERSDNGFLGRGEHGWWAFWNRDDRRWLCSPCRGDAGHLVPLRVLNADGSVAL